MVLYLQILFRPEDYLNNIDIKKVRDALIRFRFGINDLAVNKINQSTTYMNCPFCNAIDDEGHLLLDCKAYEHLRKKYLRQDINKDNKSSLCKYWMNGCNYRRARVVAMFTYYALKLRNENLTRRGHVDYID